MRSSHIAVPFLVILLCVPFFYNSCQGNILGSGFSSIRSASCKMGMEKGVPQKMEFSLQSSMEPFKGAKVHLSASPQKGMVFRSKTSGEVSIKAGAKLSVIMNTKCFDGKLEDIPEHSLRSIIYRNTSAVDPEIERQAFEWVLDKNYREQTIRNLAAADDCVLGVSWSQTYKFQSTTFNDPYLSQQTHLSSLKAPEAYDYFYDPSSGLSRAGSSLVKVAVVDTGIDFEHPDLKPRLWPNGGGYGVDITTINQTTVNYRPEDLTGHGTHVAGLIGAVADNQLGVAGLMPFRVEIMPIRVFYRDANSDIITTTQHLYNALQYAYKNGAQVINLSLGDVRSGAFRDAVVESALREAVQNGAVVTVVIGNSPNSNPGGLVDGTQLSSVPGQYSTIPGVIGVGSYDVATGNKSLFSLYSPIFAEIAAPGAHNLETGLYSTIPRGLGNYGRLMGTSQAAPLVAAAAGLTIAMIKKSYNIGPTPAEVERLILASAEKSSQLMGKFKDGNRLNLLQLVMQIGADYPQTRKAGVIYNSPSCPKQ